MLIEAAPRRTGGNLAEVTRQLGIGRTTLYRKMKDYELDPTPEKKTRIGIRENADRGTWGDRSPPQSAWGANHEP